MAKDPAFLFYPGDYLRDTQMLSEKTQVAYDRIMCEHMRNICISKQQLKFLTKRLSDDEKEELMMVMVDFNGGYQIEWIADSIQKRRKYSESRRKNRIKKEEKTKKHMNNICETYDKHMENENENENVIKDIIETLNDFSNSKFKHNAKGNIKHISARLKEGYSLDDFKDVIELKCFQWLNDSKMNSYLRPSTLFNGDKFPSYVEEARRLKNNPKLLKDEKGVKQNELDKIISGDWS